MSTHQNNNNNKVGDKLTNGEKLVMSVVHKWVATTIGVGLVVWGAMAYYVQAEDTKTRLLLQGQIDILTVQQVASIKVNQLVVDIDKKLSSIETSLVYQSQLMDDVADLRIEVNKLKVEIAKKVR